MPEEEPRRKYRKQLHVFADEPAIYAPVLPGLHDGSIDVLLTYDEFADAITNSEDVIFTIQLCALSHMFIRLGYDIYLYDNSNIIKFGKEYLKLLEEENPIQNYSFYYMMEMYKMGELYQLE